MKLKKIVWLGTAKEDLKRFPDEVKQAMGHSLYLAQREGRTAGTKKLRGFSPSVLEVISDFDTNTYRAVYTAKIGGHIYVLHCFNKKSKSGIKTPQKDIALIRKRLRAAMEHYKNTDK